MERQQLNLYRQKNPLHPNYQIHIMMTKQETYNSIKYTEYKHLKCNRLKLMGRTGISRTTMKSLRHHKIKTMVIGNIHLLWFRELTKCSQCVWRSVNCLVVCYYNCVHKHNTISSKNIQLSNFPSDIVIFTRTQVLFEINLILFWIALLSLYSSGVWIEHVVLREIN